MFTRSALLTNRRAVFRAAFVTLILAAYRSSADPPRVGEPHELLGKRLVFTNWIYVRPGDVGWTDQEGRSVFADESVMNLLTFHEEVHSSMTTNFH